MRVGNRIVTLRRIVRTRAATALPAGLASEVRHVKSVLHEYRVGHWSWKVDRDVRSHLARPHVRRVRRPGQVWGVSVVRNEADVVPAVVSHLLDQGLSGIVIADHSSDDGTRERLLSMAAAEPRLHVVLDSSKGHFQKEKITHLSRLAWRAGAEWIIPFDGDEFWFAPSGTLSEWLPSQSADVINSHTIHAVPLSEESDFRKRTLLLDLGGGYKKVGFRAHPLAFVAPGNHDVSRPGSRGGGLVNIHVPYRGAHQILGKFRRGAQALDDAGTPAGEGWHWRVGAKFDEADAERVWGQMQRGQAVPEIDWVAKGPHVPTRPLRSRSWAPDAKA
ncbi:glycosyltransferase family 2 protein [Ornithinimicrobium sp. LYQ103]|uniref:glycosyltransferase family 2 protein n=1 Tax=Ornithinimicrobium sp. LYQ103 TaxID=3378796 RepID=UPI003852DAB3